MTKAKYKVYHLKFNVAALAQALRITEPQVISTFTDGRTASRFTELWAAEVYGQADAGGSRAGYDLAAAKDMQTSVKSLTKHGVTFRWSRNIGVGRVSTPEDTERAILDVDCFIVVDITRFPEVDLVKLTSSTVYSWWKDGKLGAEAKVMPLAFWTPVQAGDVEIIEHG